MNNFDKNLGKNPTLISLSDLNSLSSTNLVGVDKLKEVFESTKFSFSSRLLNYIEPEKIKGIQKTVFYSEVNTEFDKGDKVFIINGNYDSNSYIKTNKYDLDSDGYEVLDINNGRIVLDINYDSDKLPYTEVDESDVINIYYVSSTEELEQVSANISLDDSGSIYKKFGVSSNNVIYYDGDLNHTFENIFDPSHVLGSSTNGPTDEGFHEIDGLNWNNINTDFDSSIGKFIGKKIRIINSDFGDYKKGFVYKFEDDKWIPSIENLVPIISKTNFRGGNMLGSFNSGVYGKSESVLEWNYPDAEWGGGFLYNSNWINGTINSLDTGAETFVTRLKDGVPIEESVNPNNNGFGYNYILNSNVKGGILNNGNIINSNIGNDTTNNIVKDYIENTIPTTSFIEVNGGLFLDSKIENSILKDSILNHTNIKNILFNDCLSINSQIESSVFKNSTYITDDIIRILSIKDYGLGTNDFMNKYQFEISKQSYDRLELGNYFYIKGLIFTKDPNPVNFFHLKFKLSTWVETFEYDNVTNLSKVNLKITSFLSEENDKYYVNILFENHVKITFPSTNDIDSTNAFILDSNYESGLFESSDWNSGFNINYNKNNISDIDDTGNYNLRWTLNRLKIQNSGIDIDKDEIVFLNSIKHENPTSNLITELTDTYIGLSVTGNNLKGFPSNDIIDSISYNVDDIYKTGGGYNRKGYVHKLKFTDSKIKSGMFKRTYFKNCLIENKSYDSSDKDFNDLRNIRSLLIDESIFHKNDNFLSSATYVNCLISKKEDVFINGIVYNSIWDGGVFNKGVFKESTWIDGEFNGGLFYKNRTFDANPTNDLRLKTDSRINSKYIKGKFPNNRYSWQKGTFNGGEIIKSDWEDGTFNGGRFSESKFYDGEINGGIIGNKSIDDFKTRIYNATINDTKVENAYLFTEDYEFSKVENRTITWNNGIFEKGVFGSRNFTNEKCFSIGGGTKVITEDVDYIFISDLKHSYRVDIVSSLFKKNLEIDLGGGDDSNGDRREYATTPTNFPKYYERSIKSIGDSVGNIIEITYDIRSKGYSGYSTPEPTKIDGYFGRIIKHKKDGSLDGPILEADDDLKDIYLDNDDNLYICYKTKIEKRDSVNKLLWTINNNFGNLSISGDDEFIYIGGIDVGEGYVEKWDSEGVFIWRTGPNEGLDYNNNRDYLQKIIVSDDFVFVNGVLLETITSGFQNTGKIYKLDKLNGNIDLSADTLPSTGKRGIYEYSKNISSLSPNSYTLLDYTYDDVNKFIILVEPRTSSGSTKKYFVKVTVDNMTEEDSIDISVSLPLSDYDNEHYTNMEYYNGFLYIKYVKIDPGSTMTLDTSKIFKLDISNLSSISIESDFTIPNQLLSATTDTVFHHRYDDLIFNRFDVRGVGIRYSELELYVPGDDNVDFDTTSGTSHVYNPSDTTSTSFIPSVKLIDDNDVVYNASTTPNEVFELNSIDFEVVKLSFYYSIRDTNTYTTSGGGPLPDFNFDITRDGISLHTQTISLSPDDKYERKDGTTPTPINYDVYATKWKYVEVIDIYGSEIGDSFNVEFDDIGGYSLRISKLCVYSKEGEMKSVWNDGSFNGGQFVENGQWNDGTFNGGLFLSTYGIDGISDITSVDFEYGWNNGKFNGGEFGNGQIENNSTWKNGEFNGGVFKGKLWNNGIFTNGKFEGGIDVPILGTDNSSSYMEFIHPGLSINYDITRGIWRDGFVTAKKDRFIKNKKLFTDLRKNTNDNKVVLFEDVVFESGTFSHENGVMKDSIWLDGTFESGTFEDSVFNPWFNDKFNINNDTCVWENGLFKGGDFYYSKWNGGLFNTGNAYGMIWNGGICNYMNAYNILWRSGTWKNGNWFGSDFGFTGNSDLGDFEDTIMDRINVEYGNDEYHLWNVFKDDPSIGVDFGIGGSDDDII